MPGAEPATVAKHEHKHGSRLAIVFSGSPLFTGGAGSGESEIRKWIIENDWLEAIIALPEQMFYNTGIGTYVWIVTNRKEKRREGKIELIDERGAPVPRGEVGELALCGPNVTIGCWAGPGQIHDAPNDGWYRTGDLMRRGTGDDLWFVLRKKDLIIRGGSNISPSEVERVLLAHPRVEGAGVVGVPDPMLGQRVAGFVQLANGASRVALDDIHAFAAARLADYKLPETLHIVREIPRTTIGKIDHRRLLEMASEERENRSVLIRRRATSHKRIPRRVPPVAGGSIS